MALLPLKRLEALFRPYAAGCAKEFTQRPEQALVAKRIADDLLARLAVLLDLGLGYLSLERSTPTLSPGEIQRLRLACQVRSNLFGVVYVLDEPSAGLHPADTEALLRALNQLKAAGNSLFVVEHEIDVIHRADWIVDIGPAAGELGGHLLYSGPPQGLQAISSSQTRHFIFGNHRVPTSRHRSPRAWLKLTDVTRNNLHQLNVAFPLGVLSCVTGVSGSGKSSLVSQVLVELVAQELGQAVTPQDDEGEELERTTVVTTGGAIVGGLHGIKRLVPVDQKSIGRTPRSNLATYTGLFDHVRKLFAATKMARARRYDAGTFSFNVAKGRCPHCQGEGSVMVELLFLPSVYAPCPTCQGSRYHAKTLEITYNKKKHCRSSHPHRRRCRPLLRGRRPHHPLSRHPARSRLRLPPPRPTRHRTLRRRSPTHQTRHRTPTPYQRRHPLYPRRAYHRPPPRRRRTPHGPTQPPRHRRQLRHHHRTRPPRHRRMRPRHRHGPRRRRRRRQNHLLRHPPSPVSMCNKPNRHIPHPISRQQRLGYRPQKARFSALELVFAGPLQRWSGVSSGVVQSHPASHLSISLHSFTVSIAMPCYERTPRDILAPGVLDRWCQPSSPCSSPIQGVKTENRSHHHLGKEENAKCRHPCKARR